MTSLLKKMTNPLLVAVFLLTSFSMAVDARPLNDRKTIEVISSEQLLEIIQTEGFSNAEIDVDGDIEFFIDGHLAYFILSEDYDYVFFQTWWSTDNVDEYDMNDWNAQALFSRAYIDDEGDAVLESDFSFVGGVRVAAFREYVRNAISQFHEFSSIYF
jgi:hypothetical protein